MYKNILPIFLKSNTNSKSQKGIASLITILVILSISALVIGSFSLSTANNISSQKNTLKSFDSYYASESALEDTVLRIKKGLTLPQPTPQPIGDSVVTVNISPVGASTKTITTISAYGDIYRSTQATTVLVDGKVGFNYGAQVGAGGLVMQNNSEVTGNVFSNGPVTGSSGTVIKGTALVAGNNSISGVTVNGDATAYSFSNCTIIQKRTSVEGGTVTNCPAGSSATQPSPLSPAPFPIDESLINTWKNQANQGGVVNGNVSLSETQAYGPKQINGNLTIGNNATITLNGTVYVTGTITISNNATVKLASSYGTKSDVLFSDGVIIINNNTQLKGSGNASSFLMVMSLSNSLDQSNPAINLGNNGEGTIIYAPNGMIVVNNNAGVKEVTAYKLLLVNNTEIKYASGLANTQFNTGSSTGWGISGWQEVP
jgi:hypothetical protein